MNKTEWEQSITWVRVVAGCLIKQDNKYLLVQEAQQKAYGLWNLPAGHVDKGEALEDAAVREAKEETGYEVRLGDRVGLFHDALEKPVIHIFQADICGGFLKFSTEEILDVRWLTFEEIEELDQLQKLRAEWIWEVVRQDHSQT